MRDNLNQRPRIQAQRTPADFLGEFVAATGMLSGVLMLVVLWGDIPEQIPRHFGISGEPTAWDGRWSAVAPLVIAGALYIGLTLINRIPHFFNFPWPITAENAAIQYRLAMSMITWLKAVIVWMFVLIVWSQIRVGTGDADGINPFIIVGFLVGIHVVLGIFLYRAYRYRDGDTSTDPSHTI